MQHDSDCATHNEPAYPAGKCDCSLVGLLPEDKKLPCDCHNGEWHFGCDCGNSDDAHSQGYAQGWNAALTESRGPVTKRIKDLESALGDLLEQIECLGGIEYCRDIDRYKAEAIWDDVIRQAQDALSPQASLR